MDVEGTVFRIQKYAIHDGPGIRTLVFLKGCPLRCIWCCNPESWSLEPQIMFFKERCIDCRNCVDVCPTEAINIDKERNRRIKTESCTLCCKCVDSCLPQALHLVGKSMKVREILKIVEDDAPFYIGRRGGVTLSGGEPTFQHRFSEELLKRFQEKGLNTAVETCGYCNWDILKRLSKFVDTFLYDIKVLNRKKHRRFTGVNNEVIIANLKALVKLEATVILRYPVIPGYNDESNDTQALTNFIKELVDKSNSIKRLDLLPYHNYGVYKYQHLGVDYNLKNLQPPTEAKVQLLKTKLSESLNIELRVGG